MKKTIIELDKNFNINSNIDVSDIVWISGNDKALKVHGAYNKALYPETDAKPEYIRMDPDVACKANNCVYTYFTNTSGIRVRFKTDSEYIAINCKWDNMSQIPHITAVGSSGFDFYVKADGKERFVKAFFPPIENNGAKNGYEGIYHFTTKEMREITINFPLYNDVSEFYLGLQRDASINAAEDYKFKTPIVYYGSSITQGGCASRPGNAYQAILSRAFDADFINLGFSDGARGEEVMANYIASLDMCAFVYDYDHNAKTSDMLLETHYPFYKIVREKHPDIPIICMTRPCPIKTFGAPFTKEWFVEIRQDIVRDTCRKAKEAGDNNIYFLNGAEFFAGEGVDCCTVDGNHPNDLGFYRMAKALAPVLAKALDVDCPTLL